MLSLSFLAKLILVWIISFIWTISQARIDSDHIKDKQYFNDHAPRFISRCLIGFLLLVFSWKAALITGLVFWTFFDGSLNMFLGYNFWKLGSTAKTDIFFTNHKWLYIVTKILTFVGSIIIIL